MSRDRKLSHRIFISASPGIVWKAIADLEAVQDYNPMVNRAALLPGPREGVGAGRTCVTKQGDIVERVTGWKREKAIEMELVSSPWPMRSMRWTTEIAALDGGTEVRQELCYTPKFGILGTLLDRMVMHRQMDKSIASVFEALKAYCEKKAEADA